MGPLTPKITYFTFMNLCYNNAKAVVLVFEFQPPLCWHHFAVFPLICLQSFFPSSKWAVDGGQLAWQQMKGLPSVEP